MAGFLDVGAPTVNAEYGRYVDGDLLGKIVFKNFMHNRLGFEKDAIRIPLGRFGDAGSAWNCCADAQVAVGKRWLDIEIKCARINIPNRARGGLNENWAYAKILRTSTGERKRFDVIFFIGVRTLGMEDPRYWKYMREVARECDSARVPFRQNAMPHQEEFLSICSFIIMPRAKVPEHYFRVMLSALPESTYSKYQAWGHDPTRCRTRWKSALRSIGR
jgi:hypothetical protein